MSNSKAKGFKAMAIACAVLLTCATAQMFSSIAYTTVNAETISSKYEVEENTNGTTTGKIHIDTTSVTAGTVTVKLSGGQPGATTSGEVGYWDSAASKWVGKVDTWEEQKFDESGNLSVVVKVPSGVSDVQIMLTYYADWSTGTENLLDKNSIKVSSVETGGTATDKPTNPTNPTDPSNPTNPSNPGNDKTTSGKVTTGDSLSGWFDITEGTECNNTSNVVSSSSSGETKTVTLKQGGQWSSYDEGNEPIILDQTYEPEKDTDGNDIYETDSGNERITNSNNFKFADDFGIPTGVTVDHCRFTFESDEPMYEAQFGAGISVQKGSDIANSGSTEKASMMWFNESGTVGGEEYATIKNDNGKNYGGFDYIAGEAGTQYIQAQWDVYDDVKPFVVTDAWSSVSAQYWYGVNPADYAESESPELKPVQVNITEATCTYTVDETYDYSDTISKDVNETLNMGDTYEIGLSDLGLTNDDVIGAVTIKVSGNGSDIGKLIASWGVSVSDDYTGSSTTDKNWYQGANIYYEDCSDTYEITWVIPREFRNYVKADYDAKVNFGAYYAGAGENALSNLTIQSVSVDYLKAPEVTTTSEPEVTTTAPTLPDDAKKGDVIKFEDKTVDPNDEDNHNFEIPIVDLLPDGYNPATDNIVAVTFTVSSTEEMEKYVGACGVSVSADCPKGKDYWYQDEDFTVNEKGKTLTFTWYVPADIQDYIQEDQYGKINLGAWYTGTDNVTLESAYITYVSNGEVTTTTEVTTTPDVTTTSEEPTTTTTAEPTTTTTAEPTTTTTKDDTTTTTTADPDADIVWGDANVDGKVSTADLLALKKHLLGVSELTEQGKANIDITHDGKVATSDLLKLKKYLLGTITQDDLATK